MKKFTYLLFLTIGVTACSVESLDSTENLLTADAKMKIQMANEFDIPEGICAGVPTEFKLNAPVGSNLQVQQYNEISGEWEQVYQAAQSSSNPQTFFLTFPSADIYSLRYKVRNGGFSSGMDVPVANCGCEESFTYVDNEDGTYTFTYTVGEDMDAAEVVFTFAQGAYVSGLSEAFSQNGNNGQTYKAVMDLEKCEVLEYNVTLTANCNGNSKESNVWTDFKVNEVSKKADPEDKFLASCI